MAEGDLSDASPEDLASPRPVQDLGAPVGKYMVTTIGVEGSRNYGQWGIRGMIPFAGHWRTRWVPLPVPFPLHWRTWGGICQGLLPVYRHRHGCPDARSCSDGNARRLLEIFTEDLESATK